MDRTAYTKMKIKEIQKKLEFVKHTKFRNLKKNILQNSESQKTLYKIQNLKNSIQDSELKKTVYRIQN